MDEIQTPSDEADKITNDIDGIWSEDQSHSTEFRPDSEGNGTVAHSQYKHFIARKRRVSDKANTDEDRNENTEENNIPFFRKWLVVPITIWYFGAYVTSLLTIQQYVYVKIQRDKYPNVTFNSSIPVCQANESNPDYKIQTEIQKETAQWMTYLALASGIPGLFTDLVLGSYTDKFGRKFLFFLPCIGAFLHIAVNTIGIYTDFALYWFIPASIVDGLTGQVFGLLLVTFSYTADITKPGRQRSLGIVIIESAIGIGFTGFSFSTGYFIQNTGYFWPMLSAAIFLGIALALVFILPETYIVERRKHTFSPWENISIAFSLFFGKENFGKRWKYNILMLSFILTIFTWFGRVNVETLYQLNDPFCWDPTHVGWFVTLRAGSQLVVGMALVKPQQIFFSDEVIAMVGSLSFAASFTIEGLAKQDALLYVSTAAGCLGMLTVPILRAIMSKLTPPDKQGAVFASIGCVETATNVAATVIANTIYNNTINFFKGSIFFVFVVCNLLSCILMLIYKTLSSNRNDYQTLD